MVHHAQQPTPAPANATGSVKDGTVITVPYVYRKKVVVTVRLLRL